MTKPKDKPKRLTDFDPDTETVFSYVRRKMVEDSAQHHGSHLGMPSFLAAGTALAELASQSSPAHLEEMYTTIMAQVQVLDSAPDRIHILRSLAGLFVLEAARLEQELGDPPFASGNSTSKAAPH